MLATELTTRRELFIIYEGDDFLYGRQERAPQHRVGAGEKKLLRVKPARSA